MTTSDSYFRFTQLFGNYFNRAVEYSLDENPNALGIMVPGLSDLWDPMEKFQSGLTFTEEWYSQLKLFTTALPPIKYLYKTNWNNAQLKSITFYTELPKNLSPDDWALVLSQVKTEYWHVPGMFKISKIAGQASPHGIATRIYSDGKYGRAIYWRLNTPIFGINHGLLMPLFSYLDWPLSLASKVEEDLATLIAPGSLSVLGMDVAGSGKIFQVKFDPANVSVPRFSRLLETKGASPYCRSFLRSFSAGLRANQLDYISLKYRDTGFSGWKGYWSVLHSRMNSSSVPLIKHSKGRGHLKMPPMISLPDQTIEQAFY